MTGQIITWAVLAVIIIIVVYFLWKSSKMKAVNDKILEDEFQRRYILPKDITTILLEEYGFKIYETKDMVYAVRGAISMTERVGYWEAEIQGPGKML